ncbi:unnamed protein product [Blepharisma stoltei]|uniref:Uncharacterized protein n=1 Tax=Blepharisma stoltei TaxID=1481888 RepID=A0AAU9JJ69_9CILI|nr:unnamed protein product [Blepharisma stoltei]
MDHPKRRLILHMDMNNTVIMKDEANGYSLDFTLSKILASECWGNIVEKEGAKIWKLNFNQLSFLRPDPALVSYDEFADMQYPQKTPEEEPDPARRQVLNKENKISYCKLISEFTLPGKPGYKFKSLFDKMQRCLSIPKPICDDYGLIPTDEEEKKEEDTEEKKIVITDEEDRDIIKQLFYGGKWLLIPSFYRMIQELKKSKREFSIVFRTFGSELSNVIDEFNLFCKGNHPLFNGKHGTPRLRFDGKSKSRDMIIEDYNKGYISRNPGSEDILVLGTLNRHPNSEDPEEYHAGAMDEGIVSIYRDFPSIQVAIQERLHRTASMAISDDFDYWYQNGKQSEYGKLLLIDQTDYSTLQIFFDDNIGVDYGRIVDVRDVVTGEPIPYKKAINKFIFRVDPYRAIVEADYFYKSILGCEENWNEDIRKTEAGEVDEDKGVVEEISEWDKLQQAPTEEYLSRVILPVLLPGLQVLDIERPDDPISFLALYVLKHQDMIKLPAPTPVVNNI